MSDFALIRMSVSLVNSLCTSGQKPVEYSYLLLSFLDREDFMTYYGCHWWAVAFHVSYLPGFCLPAALQKKKKKPTIQKMSV